MAIFITSQRLEAIQQDTQLREKFLEELIDEYCHSILWLAFTYVKDQQLAEEVMQDVFLTCYNRIDAFRNQSSIKTWMYRITVNKCKDELRKKSLKNFLLKQGEDQNNLRSDQQHPGDLLVQEVEDELLAQRVMSLPLKFREVIYLFYFEEMQIKEISKTFGIKENTVKTRLNRGRRMLRKMYEKEGE
ncbi:sigma-70 family RNA polymerase sigma factor [Virgibacillus kekensis]|uniref:Sigma-70 family RNA polymerase sigma factor n=1 Tax=Virgibacillus kekensis TaxID=202261 RepID=A0ABV9DI18_9BACI